MNKKLMYIISVVVSFIIIIIAFILINNNKSTDLNAYKDSTLNKSNVNAILNKGIAKDYYNSIKIDKYNLSVQLNSSYYSNEYAKIEHDASLLFYLIKKVDKITFTYNQKNYIFNYSDYNVLYSNIKTSNIQTIDNRYNAILKDQLYLGNISGIYDLYDTSDTCENNKYTIYENVTIKYELSCSNIDLISAYDNNNNSYSLKYLIDNSLIKAEDLLNKNINITTVLK